MLGAGRGGVVGRCWRVFTFWCYWVDSWDRGSCHVRVRGVKYGSVKA